MLGLRRMGFNEKPVAARRPTFAVSHVRRVFLTSLFSFVPLLRPRADIERAANLIRSVIKKWQRHLQSRPKPASASRARRNPTFLRLSLSHANSFRSSHISIGVCDATSRRIVKKCNKIARALSSWQRRSDHRAST